MCLNDKDIRAGLRDVLHFQHATDSETLILDELGLQHGAARVDMAVINGILHGYEIKSDQDDLYRLPFQSQIYSSVMDKVTIVVGNRYLNAVPDIIPEWWGIMLAEGRDEKSVVLSSIRKPQLNPTQDLLAVTKLLWRDEAVKLLDLVSPKHTFRYKPRLAVYSHLVQVADPNWLHSQICVTLRHRTNWRSDEPLKLNDG